MARLCANENFPFPAVQELRRLGHDVLAIRETGRAERATPDNQVLEFAIEQQRVLVTLNRKHFIRLHQINPRHAGIIVCSFDSDFVALARRVHDVFGSRPNLSGQLIRVNRP